MKGEIVLLCLLVALVRAAVYDHTVRDIDGKSTPIRSYEGRCALVVNIASKCGLTAQSMNWLNELHESHTASGEPFAILAFPSNSFAQEPMDDEAIKEWARGEWGAKYDLFSKVDVRSEPIYKDLIAASGDKPVKWNFEKFLVGPSGSVVGRFAPNDGMTPFSSIGSEIEECINSAK